jgi:hypothetical protein
MLESGFCLGFVGVHDITMGEAMDGVIAHNGAPLAINQRLVLQTEFNNSFSLQNVAMPVAIPTVWREINDIRELSTNRLIIAVL